MRRILLFCLTGVVFWLIPLDQVSAQKTSSDKVIIQISRDGKIVSDTTIQMKEGQDPEAVKKIILNVLEGDIQVISGGEGHQKMVWVTREDDKHMWHAEDIDVSMDTCTTHKGMVMIHKGDKPGEVHKKIIVKKGPGGEESEATVIVESGNELEISEGNGGDSKVIIITEKGDKDSDAHQKKIKVYVEEGDGDVEILDDEDLEFHKDKDADNVDVYIIKEDDGTKVIKKVKKVEVTVEEENENDDKPAEPPVKPAPKQGKKK
jgi:hypothetical protein